MHNTVKFSHPRNIAYPMFSAIIQHEIEERQIKAFWTLNRKLLSALLPEAC